MLPRQQQKHWPCMYAEWRERTKRTEPLTKTFKDFLSPSQRALTWRAGGAAGSIQERTLRKGVSGSAGWSKEEDWNSLEESHSPAGSHIMCDEGERSLPPGKAPRHSPLDFPPPHPPSFKGWSWGLPSAIFQFSNKRLLMSVSRSILSQRVSLVARLPLLVLLYPVPSADVPGQEERAVVVKLRERGRGLSHTLYLSKTHF